MQVGFDEWYGLRLRAVDDVVSWHPAPVGPSLLVVVVVGNRVDDGL